LNSVAITSPSNVFTKPSLRALHGFTNFVIAKRLHEIFANMMYHTYIYLPQATWPINTQDMQIDRKTDIIK